MDASIVDELFTFLICFEFLVIWVYSMEIWSSELIPPDKNAPQPFLQKGISPFGCHHVGTILGPAVSTNLFSQIGAYLRTHNQQCNQQCSCMIGRKHNFPLYTLLSN